MSRITQCPAVASLLCFQEANREDSIYLWCFTSVARHQTISTGVRRPSHDVLKCRADIRE